MAQGFFDFLLPKTTWTPPDMASLPSLRDAKRISLDLECRDPDIKALGPGCRRDPSKNYVVGVAIAIEDGPEFYLPFRHEGGDNLPESRVRDYLQQELRPYRGVITGAKLEYDVDWLATPQLDVNLIDHDLRDTQVADPLIDELQDKYALDVMCQRWGLPGKDEEILRQAAAAYRYDAKGELWRLPARYVGLYGQTDARRPLQLLRRQEVEIEKQGLEQVWTLERSITGPLVAMRRRGVRVDMDRVEAISRRALETEIDMLRRVHHATGVQLAPENLQNAGALAVALRAAGYSPPKGGKKNTQDSVDKEFLEGCDEIGQWLIRARAWHRIRTFYCRQMWDYAIRGSDGDYRVHCTTNQLKTTDEDSGAGVKGKGKSKGVRYGRTSATDPSLQQAPIRDDEFGELWRSIFVADRGKFWGCSDWSQQEPRIGVFYAEILGLKGAREFADEYRRNPRLDIHQKLADLSGIVRKIVKNYVNGSLYGMGDTKLCRHLNLPVVQAMRYGEMRDVPGPEGQAIIDQFYKFAPWIKGLTKAAAEAARKNLCVWTYDRRKLRFRVDPASGRVMDEHKAFNKIGQGSAAGQMKLTFLACHRAGIPIDLIVHDEFDFSFDDIRVARRVKELQLNTVVFKHAKSEGVPMMVDLEIGESWGQLKKDDGESPLPERTWN
jgi:DNA polymerase I-like protein with 3'-5' exonuclease and polymerase domains